MTKTTTKFNPLSKLRITPQLPTLRTRTDQEWMLLTWQTTAIAFLVLILPYPIEFAMAMSYGIIAITGYSFPMAKKITLAIRLKRYNWLYLAIDIASTAALIYSLSR